MAQKTDQIERAKDIKNVAFLLPFSFVSRDNILLSPYVIYCQYFSIIYKPRTIQTCIGEDTPPHFLIHLHTSTQRQRYI